MKSTNDISTVIDEVQADKRENPLSEKKVAVDIKTGKVVPDSWLRRMKGGAKYYIVSTDKHSVAECKLSVFHLKDFHEEFTIAISGRYRVRCERDSEEKAIQALYNGNHPGLVLERLIRDWVIEYSRGRLNAFIEEYFQDKRRLQEHLRDKAFEEAGLILDVSLKVDAAESLDTIKVGPTNLPIRIGQFPQEQNLKITLHLDVDENNKAVAILNHFHSHSLKDIAMREVRHFFAADNFSLHKFLTELHKDEIPNALRQHLDKLLRRYGRKVGALSLENSDSRPKAIFREMIIVMCNIQNYGKIFINNTVELSLKDVARYKHNQSPNLKLWLEEVLERVVGKELFYAKYIDLLVGFQSIEDRIKNKLSEEAEVIGYHIEQLITIPDLAPIKWKDPFSLEPVPSGEFETNNARVRVKLRIHVTLRIPDLQKIANLLNQQQDVPKLMREDVINCTKRYLHTIDPQRYYMRFSYTDKKKEKPVVKELEDRIRKALERFSPEIIEIVPLPLDTDITLRLQELMEKTCSFEIRVTPFQGGENILIKGKFQVEGVEEKGWHKFQLRKFTIEDVKESLEDYVRARLNTRSYKDLLIKYDKDLTKLEGQMKKMASQCAKEVFGLGISIVMIDRDKTAIEQKLDEFKINRITGLIETYKDIDDSKASTVQSLLEARTAAATQTGNDDEIKEYDDKIEKLLQELKSSDIPPINSMEKKLLHDSVQAEGDDDEDTDD